MVENLSVYLSCMLASCLLHTAIFPITPRPMGFPTHFLIFSFSTLFSYLLSAISYLAHILDPALALQKPEPKKPLGMETIPATKILRKNLVELYLSFSVPDKNKAIWRIPAPSIKEVAAPLRFTLVTLQLRRSYWFSLSPGRAAVESPWETWFKDDHASLEIQVLHVCARAFRCLLPWHQSFCKWGRFLCLSFLFFTKLIQICCSNLVFSLWIEI